MYGLSGCGQLRERGDIHADEEKICAYDNCLRKFKFDSQLKRHTESHENDNVRNYCLKCRDTYTKTVASSLDRLALLFFSGLSLRVGMSQ